MQNMLLGFSLLSFHIWIIFGSQDFNSNFYCFSTRFYDSKAGRFLSADPVVPEAQSNKGLSRYTYVYNNPIQFDDPDGHVPNDRSRDVRTYEDALEDYETHLLADLGYFDSAVQDDYKVVDDGGRVGQAAAFGLREVARLRNAPLTSSGSGARLLHVAHYTGEASSMDEFVKYLRPSLAGQTTDTLQAGLTVRVKHVAQFLLLDDVTNTPEWAAAKRLGFQAGSSQTSIMLSSQYSDFDMVVTRPIQIGFERGARIPIFLNLFGGVFGVASSLQYENDLAKAAGTLGGLGEITAGVSWAKNSKLISSLGLKESVRNKASLRLVGARALGFASGIVGLIAFALEYAASQDHPPPSEEALRYKEIHPDVGFKKLNGEPLEPCKGNYCLVEGTLVWTPAGFRRIEEIEVGDFVLSPMGQSKVIQASRNEVSSWLQIKTSQEILSLTANHSIRIKNRGWIFAGEVEVSDRLNNGHEILEIQEFRSPAKVYNLQVESDNVFYVGSSRILVKGLGY